MKKRSQFWYSDFMIGVIIMVTIGILFFSSIIRLYESNDKIDELISEGVLISDYFMSPGYLPEAWEDGDGRIGFVDSGRVNEGNLSIFEDLVSTSEGYNMSKSLLGIHYDYVFYFEDSEGVVFGEEFFGFDGIESTIDIENITTDHMVKLVRFVYYQDDIYKMVVVLWE